MIYLESRRLIHISGTAKYSFLQGLVTNDVNPLQSGETDILYGAMLSPQGKIRFDFFLMVFDQELYMDVPQKQVEDVLKILQLYKLRADVILLEAPELAVISAEQYDANLFVDPRHKLMGYRGIVPHQKRADISILPETNYHFKRIELGIPEADDFIADRAFCAEYGLEFLNAISFTKGCFIGQEVVARTRHRGTAHKTLHQVISNSNLPPIDTDIMLDGKVIGVMRSTFETIGLAIIRHDKLRGMKASCTADGIEITSLKRPDWFAFKESATHE